MNINTLDIAQRCIEASSEPEIVLEYVNELKAIADKMVREDPGVGEDEIIERIQQIIESGL